MSSNHAQMSQHLFSLLVKEASSLINHADLHLAHLRYCTLCDVTVLCFLCPNAVMFETHFLSGSVLYVFVLS